MAQQVFNLVSFFFFFSFYYLNKIILILEVTLITRVTETIPMRGLNRKGFAIQDIWPIALTLGITILGVAYLLQCLSTVKSGMTANSVEANAVGSGITALAQFPTNMSTIVTIIIAAILIGILVYYFMFKK